MNMPARAAGLSTRAMLVQLSVSQWTARKLDKQASAEVASNHSASHAAGNYNKSLLPREALAGITAAVSAGRATHMALTLPWLQDGSRIMPVDMHAEYARRMSDHREAFEQAVRDFVAEYEVFRSRAATMLGTLYSEADYPPPADVVRRFSWSIVTLPMPSATDFRVDLDADTVAAMRTDMERQIGDAMDAASRDTFSRLHDVVRAMADKLTGFKPELGKQGGVFRDSLVENVRELVAVLPALNVTGDARMAEAIEACNASLTPHDAQDLRDDAELRASTAAKAAEIADTLAGMF